MKYRITICFIAAFYPSQNVKVYSKKPCDSKILDICKASRSSPFKRKMIDKDSILKKVMCITCKNDYILLPFVSCIRWD